MDIKRHHRFPFLDPFELPDHLTGPRPRSVPVSFYRLRLENRARGIEMFSWSLLRFIQLILPDSEHL